MVRASDREPCTRVWGTGSRGGRSLSSSADRGPAPPRAAANRPEPLPAGGAGPWWSCRRTTNGPRSRRCWRGLHGAPGAVDILVVDDGSPDGTGAIVVSGRGGRSPGPVAGAPAEVRSRERVRGRVRAGDRPRGTTWSSRWTRTCRTSRRSSRGSWRPPRRGTTWWSGAGTSRVVRSRTGAGLAWRCPEPGTCTRGYARLPVRDATSGFRVYRREALEELVGEPIHSDGYGFQIELVIARGTLGYGSARCRSRSGNASTASRRSPAASWWRRSGWSRSGGSRPGSRRPGPIRLRTPITNIM